MNGKKHEQHDKDEDDYEKIGERKGLGALLYIKDLQIGDSQFDKTV